MSRTATEGNVVMGGPPLGPSSSVAHAGDATAAAAAPEPVVIAPDSPEPYRPWVTRLLSRYPGGLLTGLYLVLTGVGVAYDFFYFIRFRVNVLDYAQTGDFLVAALRAPVAIFYCILPVFLLWALASLRRWVRRKSAWYDAYSLKYERKWNVGPRYWDVVNTALVGLYALLFVIKYAEFDARSMREGRRKQVTVRLLSDAGTPYAAAGHRATLIGSTSGYLFLYDRAADSTYVVPVSNVAQVAVRSTPARRQQRGSLGSSTSPAVAPSSTTTPPAPDPAR